MFYRRGATDDAGGPEPISLIANSDTVIPNPGDCAAGTTFGSTAPPSAAGRRAVFVGLDNEDDPTCGGIYSGRLGTRRQKITTFVGLDTAVPGAGGQTFARIGEGLSYDGRFVGFWGAWGEATHTVRLYCPVEGNRDRRAFCNNTGVFDPDTGTRPGDPNSVCDDRSDPNYPLCYQEKEVPDRQGIFVYDSETGGLRLVAETSDDGPFSDFVYWNYSGAPPGVGHGETDAEPPRFRSSAFLAVSQLSGATVRTAFLSRTGDLDDGTNTWIDPIDGIYLAKSADSGAATVQTLLQTGMDGTLLDPEAVWDDDENPATPDVPLPITTLALEREAFRGGRLAISAKMGTEEAGWAGIYLGQL